MESALTMQPPVCACDLQSQSRLAAGGRPRYQDRVLDKPIAPPAQRIAPCLSSPHSFPIRQREFLHRRSRIWRRRLSAQEGSTGWRRMSLATCFCRLRKLIPARLAVLRDCLALVPVDIVVHDSAGRQKKILHRRHGFHHDRPGMHRRTGRRSGHQGSRCRHHGTLHEW